MQTWRRLCKRPELRVPLCRELGSAAFFPCSFVSNMFLGYGVISAHRHIARANGGGGMV